MHPWIRVSFLLPLQNSMQRLQTPVLQDVFGAQGKMYLVAGPSLVWCSDLWMVILESCSRWANPESSCDTSSWVSTSSDAVCVLPGTVIQGFGTEGQGLSPLGGHFPQLVVTL